MKTSDHNDFKLGTIAVSTVCWSQLILGSKVKGQRHRVIISNFGHPLRIYVMDSCTNFKFCS